MNRKDVLRAYQVDEHGIIQTPGKFEGEMLYVPYFWEAFLQGLADEDDNGTITFNVTIEDRAEFLELMRVRKVMLSEDDNGFVHCSAMTFKKD